jgi:hypothetical protein
MLSGVAIIVHGPVHDFGGAGIFVIVVLALIVAIFVRVYVVGGRSKGPAGHHSRRRAGHGISHAPEAGHHAGHASERNGDHGHPAAARRRPDNHDRKSKSHHG